MKRRVFLQVSASAIAASVLAPASLWAKSSKISFRKGRWELPKLSQYGNFTLLFVSKYDSDDRHIAILHSRDRFAKEIPLGIQSAHTVELSNHTNPRWGFVAGTDGPTCVVVDLHKHAVAAQSSTAEANWVFPGHAAFSPDGKYLLVPEFPKNKSEDAGFVTIRELPSLKVSKRLTTGSFKPHSVMFAPDGKSFFVTHYGRQVPEVGATSGGAKIFEWPSLKPIPSALDQWQNLAHCHIASDKKGNFLISARNWKVPIEGKSADIQAPVFTGNLAKNEWKKHEDPRFVFNFSTTSLGPGRFVVNHYQGKSVSIWKDNNLEKVIDLGDEDPLANAVSPDGKFLFVTTNPASKIHIFDAKTLNKLDEFFFPGIGYSPHLSILPS